MEFKRCTRFRSLNSGGERALERPDSYEAILLTEGALMDEMIWDSFGFSVLFESLHVEIKTCGRYR